MYRITLFAHYGNSSVIIATGRLTPHNKVKYERKLPSVALEALYWVSEYHDKRKGVKRELRRIMRRGRKRYKEMIEARAKAIETGLGSDIGRVYSMQDNSRQPGTIWFSAELRVDARHVVAEVIPLEIDRSKQSDLQVVKNRLNNH